MSTSRVVSRSMIVFWFIGLFVVLSSASHSVSYGKRKLKTYGNKERGARLATLLKPLLQRLTSIHLVCVHFCLIHVNKAGIERCVDARDERFGCALLTAVKPRRAAAVADDGDTARRIVQWKSLHHDDDDESHEEEFCPSPVRTQYPQGFDGGPN